MSQIFSSIYYLKSLSVSMSRFSEEHESNRFIINMVTITAMLRNLNQWYWFLSIAAAEKPVAMALV